MTLLLLRLLDERKDGRAILSSDDASFEQLLMDAVAAAKTEINSADEKKVNKTAAKAKQKKKMGNLLSWLIGGIISLMMIVNLTSITTLIPPFSLIHQIGASGEGEAPPVLQPSASRSLRKRQGEHQSNKDNAASPEIIGIVSPLPVVAPPPIFSPAVASNHRSMKINKLRSETCFDTPNWKDRDGDGCDWYEEKDSCCSYADNWAGDMGPATEHCCFCGGGSVSLPPTISLNPTSSPTKSAAPSISPTSSLSTFPTKSATPSISPTITTFPTKSATPSTSPTITTFPTKSAIPSTYPTTFPSIFPTKSAIPSTSPTSSPSTIPTK